MRLRSALRAVSVVISMMVLSMLVLAGCATPPKKRAVAEAQQPPPPPMPPEIMAIQELEDSRSLGDGKLVLTALTSESPAVRKRALLALGRLQAPETAEPITKGLSDPDPGARAEAAFAVGLMGLSLSPISADVRAKMAAALRDAEKEESDPVVKLAMIEALGRVAHASSIDRLVERLAVAGEVQARAAISLGTLAKNAQGGATLPAKAFSALQSMLKKEAPLPARYGAAYALAQSKNPSARAALIQCATDDGSEIRAICVKGLGDIGSDADAPVLKTALDDSDYRVAVEATRALVKIGSKCRATCPSLTALADLSFRAERLIRGDILGGAPVLLAFSHAQQLPAAAKQLVATLRAPITKAAQEVTDTKVKTDLANIDCRLAAAQDRLNGTLQASLDCGANLIPDAQRLSAALQEIGANPPTDAKRVMELASYLVHNEPRVKLATLNLLSKVKVPGLADKVRPMLANPDLILASAAALVAAKQGDKAAVPAIRELAKQALTSPGIAPAVAEALATLGAKDAIAELEAWLASPVVGLRIEGAGALSKLKGTTVAVPWVDGPKAAPLTRLPLDSKVLLKTSKGDIELKLFTEDAPRTSTNFVELAKKGFFKNLTFHRIVPNFVAQGGDPRGDGEGGPPYTIPCEINHHLYSRGIVGMALWSKDTGNSQFFLTASPQPHLDGRYTTFAEVTKGDEVIDLLLEDDRILDVQPL